MNTDLLNAVLEMQRRDLDLRQLLLTEGRLYDGYADDMQQIHTENAQRLDELVALHGWPTVARVGLDGSRAAWMIAQHAICTPNLQRKFLALLTEAAEAGEVPLRQVAFLTDRVRAAEERPQVYGTVLNWDGQGELSCEIEDPDGVDARRREIGLPPFAEDLAAHRRAAAAEGAQPHADFARWQREKTAWAKRVGWIV